MVVELNFEVIQKLQNQLILQNYVGDYANTEQVLGEDLVEIFRLIPTVWSFKVVLGGIWEGNGDSSELGTLVRVVTRMNPIVRILCSVELYLKAGAVDNFYKDGVQYAICNEQ